MAAVNVTSDAGAQKRWDEVEAMQVRLAALLPLFDDAPALLHQQGAGAALGYLRRREAGQFPDEVATEGAALGGAQCLLVGDMTGNDFGFGFSLRVIADAHARFPDNAQINQVKAKMEEGFGDHLDWSEIAPITG